MLSIERNSQTLSPAVAEFAQIMQYKLDQNQHKGLSWTGLSRIEIKNRIREELVELDKAIANGLTPGKVTLEAADVANFALFAALTKGKL